MHAPTWSFCVALSQSLLPSSLTPEVALFDSSHNPLGKKGVSLTGRMCQAIAESPLTTPSNPKPPPTGPTK
ncbi:hypothetical protein PBY51_010609 [Eleginops maclovinus]|uniref:Uncharacterized protein n=1 Tax=Eleginops maclovinus TaxID=56733 RepID=A0AAN7X916_ELEMC|nr:hypothetical protein PBY51_010609 [Eleginops maclovinus]